MGVATAIAIGGLVVSAATTTKSFIDAGKQNKLKKEADQDAKNAMDAARKKLEVNYYDLMAVKKEPYELEREAMLSQGAQAIEAGQEQERGAAATAGRVQMAMNEGQSGIRTAMGKEMTDIEKLQLGEDSRLRDVGVQLDLGEAEGAQAAARDAQQAAAAATSQAWQGVASTAQQGLAMVSLYPKTASARQAAKLGKTAMGTGSNQLGLSQADMQNRVASMGSINGTDLSKVGGMNSMEYNAFMGGLDKATLKQIRAKFPSLMPNSNITGQEGDSLTAPSNPYDIIT
jgi:vacuolar-type H+-ATPase subunit H/type II secretory pathway pseudopilin PulG